MENPDAYIRGNKTFFLAAVESLMNKISEEDYKKYWHELEIMKRYYTVITKESTIVTDWFKPDISKEDAVSDIIYKYADLFIEKENSAYKKEDDTSFVYITKIFELKNNQIVNTYRCYPFNFISSRMFEKIVKTIKDKNYNLYDKDSFIINRRDLVEESYKDYKKERKKQNVPNSKKFLKEWFKIESNAMRNSKD